MISDMLRFAPLALEGLDDLLTTEPAFTLMRNRLHTYPQINMGVTDNSVEVYLFVPGMDAESLDVSLEKNLLSVSAERKDGVTNDDDTMSRRERFSGRFKRVITLPEDVDPDKTEAVYRHGVLHISVAKREEALPRKIQVNV